MAESITLKEMFSDQSSRDVQGRTLGTGLERARRRVMVIGLDCAAPELIFDRWLDDLPNLKSICQSGLHGPLRSCDPPITVPAWSVMMSSKSPGRLGVYGFRNRADHSYDHYSIANSLAIKEDRLWDISRAMENDPRTYRIPLNRKRESQHRVNGCETSRSQLRC